MLVAISALLSTVAIITLPEISPNDNSQEEPGHPMKQPHIPKTIQTVGQPCRLTRRGALGALGGMIISGSACSERRKRESDGELSSFFFGLVTDLHYADKEPWSTRYYRDSLAKLTEAVAAFNSANAAFAVELGDIIDKADKEIEYGYLRDIDAVFRSFNGGRHYVIGNHDVATFSKDEFLSACGSEKNYYSFDMHGRHFVVLDANYNKDGSPYNAGNFDWKETYIPESELSWLSDDLAAAKGKRTAVFIHQNLHDETDPHGVKNAPDVRRVIEDSGCVSAVFQGHMHTGGYMEIEGIPYVTLRAAVEGEGTGNNSYAIVHWAGDGSLKVEGFGKQQGYNLQIR